MAANRLFQATPDRGKAKTAEGTGRTIPLNSELLKALAEHQTWYQKNAGKPSGDHFVFPRGAHKQFDATKSVTSFKRPGTGFVEKPRFRRDFTI